MKILHLSDTHGAHGNLTDLPKADLIIHSGDVGMTGTEKEIIDFLNWFLDLPYRYKIFVPGNHDHCLFGSEISGLDDNCFILINKGVEIEGRKIYGVPGFVEYVLNGEEEYIMNAIPDDIEILVTHQPPLGILDYARGVNYGSLMMQRRVMAIRPEYHLFGHVHDSYGILQTKATIYSNAALMDEDYQLKNMPRLLTV